MARAAPPASLGIVSRVPSIILAALAVHYVFNGISGFVASLHRKRRPGYSRYRLRRLP